MKDQILVHQVNQNEAKLSRLEEVVHQTNVNLLLLTEQQKKLMEQFNALSQELKDTKVEIGLLKDESQQQKGKRGVMQTIISLWPFWILLILVLVRDPELARAIGGK